ncbi:MAG TPA: S24/S26 family peptidase [Chloroflexota bacterium]|jgi:signal peptidase I|nr:S24/S26 family peptidase [Chloroflexota bacterium]
MASASTRWLGAIASVAGLLALIAAWLVLAPVPLGGSVSYVSIVGNSMLPGIRLGDLVLVRRSATYEVGQVVAYRHPDVGTVVHRIVATDGVQYTLQGDNNTWLDSYTPRRSEVLGTLWMHLPGGGTLLGRLRSPIALVLMGLLLGAVALQGSMPHSGSRAARRLAAGRQPASAARRSPTTWSEEKLVKITPMVAGARLATATAAWAAVAGLAAAALLVFTAGLPPTREALRDVTYTLSGAFSYSASVPPSSAYDGTTVATGMPLFRRLVDEVTLRFEMAARSEAALDVRGAQRLLAVIADTNGWERTVELRPTESFSGSSTVVEGVLSLAAVQALVDGVNAETGLFREQYTIAVVPEVTLEGAIGGQPVNDRFAPKLTFRVDPYQAHQVIPAGSDADPLAPSRRGLLRAPVVEPNAIPLLAASLPVSMARTGAHVVLGVSVVTLLAAGALLLRYRPRTALERVWAQYGPMIVSAKASPGGPTLDVTSMDDLARMAQWEGRMILHTRSAAGGDCFTVAGEGVTYRYAPDPTGGSAATSDEAPASTVRAPSALPGGSYALPA